MSHVREAMATGATVPDDLRGLWDGEHLGPTKSQKLGESRLGSPQTGRNDVEMIYEYILI